MSGINVELGYVNTVSIPVNIPITQHLNGFGINESFYIRQVFEIKDFGFNLERE